MKLGRLELCGHFRGRKLFVVLETESWIHERKLHDMY